MLILNYFRIKCANSLLYSFLLWLTVSQLSAGDFSALTRAGDVKLRIGNYNVMFSSCFPSDDDPTKSGNAVDRMENFGRIVRAIDADIWSFQEVFHAKVYFTLKTDESIRAFLEQETGESWEMAHDYEFNPATDPGDGSTGVGGRFIFSRYPIIKKGYFSNRVSWALINLPDSINDKDVLVVCVHYSNDTQAVKTGEFIARVAAGNENGIPSDVMIMVNGDFNGQPGKARYNGVFNSIPDFTDLQMTHLGWDEPNYTSIGSTLLDNNGNPLDIYNKVLDDGTIQQKTIDYMFWRSDRLLPKHAHFLNPPVMDQATLNAYGLHQIDTAGNPDGALSGQVRCDHWPFFADFYDPNSGGNTAPVISTSPMTTIQEGDQYSYQASGSDADGDSLTWVGLTIPSWLSFDVNTALLSGTPSEADVGEHPVKIRLKDGTANANQTFTVTVFAAQEPGANLILNPSFENGGAAPENWSLSNTGLATVSTEEALQGSSSLKLSTPTAVQITPTKQTIDVIPNTDYEVSFWVQNAGQTAGSIVFDMADKPSVAEDLQFLIAPGAATGWTKYSGTWNSGTDTSATIRLFANASFIGTAYIDHLFLGVPDSVANTAPVITSTAITDAFAGVSYSYNLQATDADGDSLVFSGVNIPTWLTFDSDGLLNGLPTESDVASHLVTLRVSDGEDIAEQSFLIEVAPGINEAPTWSLSAVTLVNAMEGESYSVSIASYASDPEGDALTFSVLSSSAEWASVSAEGLITGIPGSVDLGFNVLTIAVSDGVNSPVNCIFSITVDEPLITDDYSQWKDDHGIIDDMADDDNDGIKNIMEFALGGNPKSAASGKRPSVTKEGSNFEIKFNRAESSLTYVIEKSTDLVTWTEHITVTDSHGVVGTDCSVPVSLGEMNHGKLFLRLKIVN